MNRAYGILALVLVLIVGFRVGSLVLGQKDDATMIRESLRQSLEASRKGEPGSVLDLLSSSITVNGEQQEGGRSQIADFIRKQKPDIAVANQTPIVTGDEARITSPVTITASLPVLGDQTFQLKDVVMTFQKESAREYLVVPVKKWRLTGVTAPADAISSLAFGAG
jgi:hypothetical protein